MFGDIVYILKNVTAILKGAGSGLKNAVLNAVVLAIFAVVAYGGFHVSREGSFSAGMRAAFVDSKADITQRAALETAYVIQAELRQAAASDILINDMLMDALQKFPDVARAVVAQLHNGDYGLSGMGLLKFNITHAQAAAGRAVGELSVDAPLSEWSDFLHTLLNGKCSYYLVQALKSNQAIARHAKMRVTSFMACPVKDTADRLLGGIVVSWDLGDTTPSEEERANLAAHLTTLGSKVAVLIDLAVSTRMSRKAK